MNDTREKMHVLIRVEDVVIEKNRRAGAPSVERRSNGISNVSIVIPGSLLNAKDRDRREIEDDERKNVPCIEIKFIGNIRLR